MRRKRLHFPDYPCHSIPVGCPLVRALFFLLPESPVSGITGCIFITQVDKRTNQSKRPPEHFQPGRHTGHRTVKHHTHQKAFYRIIAMMSQRKFIASQLFGYLEQSLPPVPGADKTSRFAGTFPHPASIVRCTNSTPNCPHNCRT